MRYLSHKEEIWFFRQVNFMKDEWVVKIYWNSRWSDAVLGWRHVGRRLCIGERERGKIEGRWINGRWKQILVATTWHSTLLCDTEDVLYRVYRTRALLQEVGKCILSCNGKSKTPQKWNWYEVGKMNLMFRQIIKFMVWHFCFFAFFLEKNKRSQLSFPCHWRVEQIS